MLGGERARIELAYSLMMTLPGSPVLEYGDEIGMGDDLSLVERNAVRTPMQWSTEPHAGFTKNAQPVLPVITGGPFGYERVNVAQQRRDPNSLLNWMERIIRMRKEVPEIGWGDFTVLETHTDAVLALLYEWRNNAVVIVHNLAGEEQPVQLRLRSGKGDDELVNLLSDDHSHGRDGQHTITLEPYGYRWYRVGGLDYLLERSD